MPPSAKILERDLKKAARDLFKNDEEDFTVNAVRKRAEGLHDLQDGFFTAPDWKAKSKAIIKDCLEKLQNGEDSAGESDDQTPPSPMVRAKPKAANGVKRSSPSVDKPAAKRQKKTSAAKPTKRKPQKKAVSESELSDEEESELSEEEESAPESDLSEDEEPPPKKRAKKAAPKRVTKKAATSGSESELSDPESSAEEEQPKPQPKTTKAKAAAKPKSSSKAVESESEADKMSVDNDKKDEAKHSTKPKTIAPEPGLKTGDIINSDSELSSVIDEPPPKKRGKGAAAKGKPKASTTKAPKELSADEEEIKKLQGQLVKCGIRKIWGIELKKYGDDAKAKIRHLRGMLADVGMTGRFSEARAKEIKEQRELMADLEAVQDMNALWGDSAKGGRASRSRANRKSLKEASDDDDEVDEAGDDDGDDGEETKGNSRVSKRMADLAFLGDESESD